MFFRIVVEEFCKNNQLVNSKKKSKSGEKGKLTIIFNFFFLSIIDDMKLIIR